MAATVTLNDAEVRRALAKAGRLPDELPRLLAPWLEEQLGGVQQAAQNLAPEKEGTLRRSGWVDVALSGGAPLVGTVEFGLGLAEPYAFVQHENLSYHHTDGQAHFLHGGEDSPDDDSTSAWGRAKPQILRSLDGELSRLGGRAIQP